MKQLRLLLFVLLPIAFLSCSHSAVDPEDYSKQVLVLQVDYLTHQFEGGKELQFEETSSGFSLSHQYVSPGDFGSIKIIYDDIDETLFYGTIHWMGMGERIFPESLLPKDSFDQVLTNDYRFPMNGFENVFNPSGELHDYNEVWTPLQGLTKVREYLDSNPTEKVKLFLYTPGVGVGDPTHWKWIVFMKN